METTQQWTPVLSSAQIAGYRYNAEAKELDILFTKGKKGTFYRYFEVPAGTFETFMYAHSKGQAFDTFIKKGDFKFEKLTEATPESQEEVKA